MKKRFWKIEYSITLFVLIGIILLLIPTSVITSKEATYISKWNETFNKIDYVFTAMNVHANTNLLTSLNKAKTNNEREALMIQLVKPYLRIHLGDEIKTTKYVQHYMNGNRVNSKDMFYFEKIYQTENNKVIGIKDIKDNDIFHPGFLMMFDMNGTNGPNTWGKDIYGVNIFSDGKITPIGSGWDIEDLKSDCNERGSGVSCSHYYRIGGEFNE